MKYRFFVTKTLLLYLHITFQILSCFQVMKFHFGYFRSREMLAISLSNAFTSRTALFMNALKREMANILFVTSWGFFHLRFVSRDW